MSTSPPPTNEEQPRDAAYWSSSGSSLKVTNIPSGALNLDVDGRQVVGPLQGFGQMWQKIYRIRLKADEGEGVPPLTAKAIIKAGKENFPKFWPAGNRFYAPLTGIAPGEVALLSLSMPGGMALSTGVLVLYADDESFTLMTPQGHMFAGWITFSAHEEDNTIVTQAQVLMRANDPLYELGMRFGGHKQEDVFWQYTLKSLAAYFNRDEPVEMQITCVDTKMQWSYAKNIWHNAAMRTAMYTITAPTRWVKRKKR